MQWKVNMVARQLIRSVKAIYKQPCDCGICGARDMEGHKEFCPIASAQTIANELYQLLEEPEKQ